MPDQQSQGGLDGTQIGKPTAYILTMSDGGLLNILARPLFLVGQAEKAAHLVESEAKFPGPTDESEACDFGGAVNPAATLGTPQPR